MIMRNLPPFKKITSIPSKYANYFFGLSALLPVFMLLVLLVVIPFSFTVDLCMFYFLSAILVFLIVLFFDLKRKIAGTTTIIIDDIGIHYINKFRNQIVVEILWKNFINSQEFFVIFRDTISNYKSNLNYDIYVKEIGSYKFHQPAIFFSVLVEGKVINCKETFFGEHIFSKFYSNRAELIRAFLLGLSHFRPDITIHSDVFNTFNINTDNFRIEQPKPNVAALIFTIIAIIIFAIWVYHTSSGK